MGLCDIPSTAVTGCGAGSVKDVDAEGVFTMFTLLDVVMAAIPLPHAHFAVDIILHEGMIRGRVREVIGAVHCVMVNKKAAAFYTTFVVVEEFTLGIK